ncbi:MAG: amidohydrolase family protein [Lentisphaeria bacterium]|nr:amidohydrolase family protein [Lentisphaeria bacterium]
MKLIGNIVAPAAARHGFVEWENDRIVRVELEGEIRPDGPWILPGFIDLHLHGTGEWMVEGGRRHLAGMAAYAAEKGMTRFTPAYASGPRDETVEWLRTVRSLVNDPPPGALIAGAHLEGPWLSRRFGGGMNAVMLRPPDTAEAQEYLDAAGGTLRLVTLAPELPGAPEVIRLLKANGVTVSIGHSACPPERFAEAVDEGISQACHLFDAWEPPVNEHGVRQPAVTDLVLIEDRVMKEIIMDGLHVPPPLVKLALRAAGADHILAITDSLQGAGLPEGRFMDSGRPYVIRDGELARLEATGTIVGSSLTMNRAFFNMTTRFGFTETEAVKCLSTNPAKQIGLAGVTGELRPGLAADLAVLEPDRLTVRSTWLAGRQIYGA